MSAAPDSVVALNWRIPNNVKSSPSKILPMIRAMNLLLFLSFFLTLFCCLFASFFLFVFFFGGGGALESTPPWNPRRPVLSAAFEAWNTKWAPRRLFEHKRYTKWLSLDCVILYSRLLWFSSAGVYLQKTLCGYEIVICLYLRDNNNYCPNISHLILRQIYCDEFYPAKRRTSNESFHV